MVGPVTSPGLLLGQIVVKVETVPHIVLQQGPDPHGKVIVAVHHRVFPQHSVHSFPSLGRPGGAGRGEELGGGGEGEADQAERDVLDTEHRHHDSGRARVLSGVKQDRGG